MDWYKERCPKRSHPQQLIFDKSPYYIFHPLCAERIYAHCPLSKIVIMLRNPIDRTYSHYWFNVRYNKETYPFEVALELEKKRLEGEYEKFFEDLFYQSYNYRLYSYLARSRYVEQLKVWLDYFPREQIYIVLDSEL